MFGRTKTDGKDGADEAAFEAVKVEEVEAGDAPEADGETAEDETEPDVTDVDVAAVANGDTTDHDAHSVPTAANGDARVGRGQTLGERLSELRAQLQRTPSVVAEVAITVRTGAGFAAIEGLLAPGARHLFLLQAAIGRTGDLQLQREMETLVTTTIAAHRKDLDDERERLETANRAGGNRASIRFSGERRMKVTMKATNAMQLIGIVESIDGLATAIQVAAFSRTIDLSEQHQLEDNLRQRCNRLVEHLRKLEVQALRGYNDQVRRHERAARSRAPRRRPAGAAERA